MKRTRGLLLSPPKKKGYEWKFMSRQRINDTDRVVVEALSLPITLFPFQSKIKDSNTLGSILVLALAQEE
jgi:hypothetical protein